MQSRNNGESWGSIDCLTDDIFETMNHGYPNIFAKRFKIGVVFWEDYNRLWHAEKTWDPQHSAEVLVD